MRHSPRFGIVTLLLLLLASGTWAFDLQLVWNEAEDDIFPGDPSSTPDVDVLAGVDTDGDGKQEIILLRLDGFIDLMELVIYETTGDNQFERVFHDYIHSQGDSSPLTTFISAAVADTDGDGFQEIWFTKGAPLGGPSNELFVYENTGDNAWGAAIPGSENRFSQAFDGGDLMGTEFLALAIADFDGDGALEIVVADDEGNELKVFQVSGNIPAATLVVESPNLGSLNGSPHALIGFDLDGVGNPEIISGWMSQSGLGIHQGTGAGTYTLAADLTPGPAASAGALPKTGAMVGLSHGGQRAVFWCDSDLGDVYALQPNGPLGSLTVADAQLWVTGASLGLADEDPSPVPSGQYLAGQALATGDMDDDGLPELYYAVLESTTLKQGGILVWEYSGSGRLDQLSSYTALYPDPSVLWVPDYPGGVVAGMDMDNDGLRELVIAGPEWEFTPQATGRSLYLFEVVPSRAADWHMY